MHKSPFSPSFSIRPERFYGRAVEIELMRNAIANPDSPQRYLFVTGTRGVGKTSLIHQFALIAQRSRWTVLETTYQNAVEVLRSYAGADVVSQDMVSISPTITAGGASASVGAVTHHTSNDAKGHLAAPFAEKLAKSKFGRGVFISIDEVQKIREAEMEEICHAVQAAKTAGLPIALVLAGLPGSFSRLRSFKGCTFIQRMERLSLGTLGKSETVGFLRTMFALVPELALTDDQIGELAAFSAGHPYLLQLAGNAVYDGAAPYDLGLPGGTIRLSDGEIHEAERRAMGDYQRNVLRNLLVDVKNGTRGYLQAMCEVCDDESTASTSDIARKLGKTLQECSPTRARLIDLQLVDPVDRGKLRFSLPYFPLAFEEDNCGGISDQNDRWAPRKFLS